MAALLVVMSVVMGKADDSQVIRRFLAGLGIELGILLMANRRKPVHYDAEKDELQEKVERWFNKLTSSSHFLALSRDRTSSHGRSWHSSLSWQLGLWRDNPSTRTN